MTLENMQAQKMAVQFVVDGGHIYENSRIHCVDVIYRDAYYIQHSIRAWALTIEEAYQQARDKWLAEKEAGRAL